MINLQISKFDAKFQETRFHFTLSLFFKVRMLFPLVAACAFRAGPVPAHTFWRWDTDVQKCSVRPAAACMQYNPVL